MADSTNSEPTPGRSDDFEPPSGPGVLSHINQRGEARIVDITGKVATQRRALARCRVALSPEALDVLNDDHDVRRLFGEATVIGIMAAKRTSRLIPLCHPIKVDHVDLALRVVEGGVEIEAIAEAFERTGLEMEALTACAIAALSIVGAFRKFEPKPTIGDLTLWEKSGGRSGNWMRSPDASTPSVT